MRHGRLSKQHVIMPLGACQAANFYTMDPITGTVTSTLPISTYMELFTTPLVVTAPEGYVPITGSFNLMGVITQSAPIAPYIVGVVSDSMIRYYLGLRVGLTAILIIVAWVAKRIGMPVRTTSVMVAGRSFEKISLRGK